MGEDLTFWKFLPSWSQIPSAVRILQSHTFCASGGPLTPGIMKLSFNIIINFYHYYVVIILVTSKNQKVYVENASGDWCLCSSTLQLAICHLKSFEDVSRLTFWSWLIITFTCGVIKQVNKLSFVIFPPTPPFLKKSFIAFLHFLLVKINCQSRKCN